VVTPIALTKTNDKKKKVPTVKELPPGEGIRPSCQEKWGKETLLGTSEKKNRKKASRKIETFTTKVGWDNWVGEGGGGGRGKKKGFSR